MVGIKISVDDIRAIPDGYDLLFLNPENFISWRKDNLEIEISELSLDHDMGLDYYGCELDPDYFREGCKRYNQHIKQLNIFA